MTRVMAEDRRQVETVINGTKYRAHRGYFDFGDRADHAAAHRQSGNLPAPALSGPTRRSIGYRCTACRRGSYFTRCTCGGTCVREG